MLKMGAAVFCALPLLAGCAAVGGVGGAAPASNTAFTAEINDILAKAGGLHQLDMALAALKQAPVVVMQPTPVVVTPTMPPPPPPVVITPVPTVPPPSTGGPPPFPPGPVVKPSLRKSHYEQIRRAPVPIVAPSIFAKSTFRLVAGPLGGPLAAPIEK